MPTGTAPVDGPACLTPEQAVQWATTMLRPGVALVIGISIPTGSAAATEIAVLDTDGRVRAHDWLGEGSSRALHTMVQAVGSRHLLAYNAANVRDWVVVDAQRAGVRVGPLADPRRWGCIMRARSRVERRRWQRLDAGHRALGDAQAAREVLDAIAHGRLLATVA